MTTEDNSSKGLRQFGCRGHSPNIPVFRLRLHHHCTMGRFTCDPYTVRGCIRFDRPIGAILTVLDAFFVMQGDKGCPGLKLTLSGL